MIPSRAAPLLFAAFTFAAPGATRAAADVDVEVPLALSARGSLVPAGDVETYRFTATNGTLLGFQVAAGKGAHLAFTARLFGPTDVEVPIPTKYVVLAAKKLAVSKFPLAASGAYRLEISATGTGEYSLALSGKPQAKFGAAPPLLTGTAAFAFSAPPGSRVTLSAKATGASQATPRFGALTGGGVNVDLSTSKTLKPHGHVVVVPSIGGTGDLSVDVTNSGAAGNVAITAAVTPPKAKTLKVDVRGVARGRPFGGESVVVRVVGPEGGSVQIDDATSDLRHATVVIPQGAYAGAAVVTIASAIAPKTSAADQTAGPAVFLGPPGLRFAVPVNVAIPYDPARIPVGLSPLDLRVFVVQADGSSAFLVPTSFDDVLHTVTIATSHFSTFVAVATAGQQPLGVRPGGDAFWTLNVDGEIFSDASQNSRRRKFTVGFGEATFQTGGVLQGTGAKRSFTFDNPTSADGNSLVGSLSVAESPDNFAASWSYGADGQTVLIDGVAANPLVTSADGNFIVAGGDDADEARAELNLFVRKNTAPLDAAGLAGKYHLVFWILEAEDRAEKGVRPRSSRATGTWTFGADGKFALTGSYRASDITDAGEKTSKFEPLAGSGTFVVEPAGTVVATLAAQGTDPEEVFRFFPGPQGVVLIGTDKDAPGRANLKVFALVRQGTALGNATATGEYLGVQFATEMVPYHVTRADAGPDIDVVDFQVSEEDLALTFSGAGALTAAISKHDARRDELDVGGVRIRNQVRPVMSVSSKIDKTGRITLSGNENPGQLGVIAPDGVFSCGVSSPADPDEYNGLLFFVKPPPKK